MTLILSWNVAGRIGERCEQQLACVIARDADIVCLQEVTPSTKDHWAAGLAAGGYFVTTSDFDVSPRGSRRFGVLIATRDAVTRTPVPGLPWPERHLAVTLSSGVRDLTIHTLHAPTSFKPDEVKVLTLEAVHAAAVAARSQCVIAGDLNTPRYESREGIVSSFARTRAGNIRPQLGERHDRAELALISDLPARGWSDAFRSVHGYRRRDRSWRAGRGYGYRLDHVLLSPGLTSIACDYVHEWRECGLSDHSAMWAAFERVGTSGRRGPAQRPPLARS